MGRHKEVSVGDKTKILALRDIEKLPVKVIAARFGLSESRIRDICRELEKSKKDHS